jgi:Xaa-Pro aminopeptidase
VSAARVDRLTARLAERELDALLVTHLVNVRYLSGFSGTNGACLVWPDERLFFTDFRYTERAAEEVEGFEVVTVEREMLKTIVARLPQGRLGFEDRHVSVHMHSRLVEQVGEGIELVAAGTMVEDQRMVKDADELRKMRAASELGDSIYEYVRDRGLVGRTEREVQVDLEHEMRERGADDPSFPSIVAAGANGALPHASPRKVEIPNDTLVILDLGCQLDGYCSDCTRTFATGDLDEEAMGVYDLVESAQLAALEAVRPGAGLRAVDNVARDLISEAGHGDHFGHGLGHGVGLEIHEEPRLAQSAPEDGKLEAGNTVTVEPGVYVSGKFGVRIEDLVAVTDDGREILTHFPKSLTTVA